MQKHGKMPDGTIQGVRRPESDTDHHKQRNQPWKFSVRGQSPPTNHQYTRSGPQDRSAIDESLSVTGKKQTDITRQKARTVVLPSKGIKGKDSIRSGVTESDSLSPF